MILTGDSISIMDSRLAEQRRHEAVLGLVSATYKDSPIKQRPFSSNGPGKTEQENTRQDPRLLSKGDSGLSRSFSPMPDPLQRQSPILSMLHPLNVYGKRKRLACQHFRAIYLSPPPAESLQKKSVDYVSALLHRPDPGMDIAYRDPPTLPSRPPTSPADSPF